jgi:hypothetical protein
LRRWLCGGQWRDRRIRIRVRQDWRCRFASALRGSAGLHVLPLDWCIMNEEPHEQHETGDAQGQPAPSEPSSVRSQSSILAGRMRSNHGRTVSYAISYHGSSCGHLQQRWTRTLPFIFLATRKMAPQSGLRRREPRNVRTPASKRVTLPGSGTAITAMSFPPESSNPGVEASSS